MKVKVPTCGPLPSVAPSPRLRIPSFADVAGPLLNLSAARATVRSSLSLVSLLVGPWCRTDLLYQKTEVVQHPREQLEAPQNPTAPLSSTAEKVSIRSS